MYIAGLIKECYEYLKEGHIVKIVLDLSNEIITVNCMYLLLPSSLS